MGLCKEKYVISLLAHWSYVFLALTHWYVPNEPVIVPISESTVVKDSTISYSTAGNAGILFIRP